MKTYRTLPLTTAASLGALALGLVGAVPLLAKSHQAAGEMKKEMKEEQAGHPQGALRVAGADAADRGAQDYAGRDIVGKMGEKLGTVDDFAINPKSGKVAFVAVSSGGFLGIGDRLRVLPFQALHMKDDKFSVDLDEASWKKLARLNEQDWEEGRVNVLTAATVGTEAGAPAGREPADAAERAGELTEEIDYAGLVRASKVRGKEITAGQQQVGTIEDIVIDFDHGTVTALLDPESEFTGTDEKFLVPFGKLEMGVDAQEETIMTSLASNDFRQLSTGAVATTEATPEPARDARQEAREIREPATVPTTDEQLTPTGRESTPQLESNIDPKITSAARAVRQALDQDSTLAKAGVEVVPQVGRLLIRGNVADEKMKEAIEDKVDETVDWIDIEYQLMVKKQ